MIIVLSFSEVVGGVLGLFSLVMLLIMGLKTNYVQVGFSMGFAVLGLVLVLLITCMSIMMLKEKKTRKEGLIYLLITVICMIVGYFIPSYSETFKIAYSNIMSIFVTPLIVYIVLLTTILIRGKIFFSGGMVVWYILCYVVSLMLFIFSGVGIIGINYVISNDKFLDWVDDNFRYENRFILERRERLYNTDNFEEILKTDLEKLKSEYDVATFKDKLLNDTYDISSNMEFEISDCFDNYDNATYTCVFKDKAKYGEKGEYVKYYAKLDLNNFTVVDILKNRVGATEEDEIKFINRVEASSEVSTYDALKYALICLKYLKLDITKENIATQINLLRDDKLKVRSDITRSEDGKYLIVILYDSFQPTYDTYEIDMENYTCNIHI